MEKLLNLRPMGQFSTNCGCGLSNWDGTKRLAGCGKIGRHERFYYDIEGYDGKLWSSVSLCKDCLKKLGK